MSPRFNPSKTELYEVARSWTRDDMERFVSIWESDTFATVRITSVLYCVAGDMIDVIRQILHDLDIVKKRGDS